VRLSIADDFDPLLAAKAQGYQEDVMRWHSTGLGGVSDIIFTDDERTEIYRTKGAGDSTDWTGFYLTTQAIRYIATGEQEARDEVLRIANYLHIVKDITDDPGYIARYVGIDEPPWNVEYEGHPNKIPGEGQYEGYFWLGHQVRDKYITWFWSLTWAYDAVDDERMRETIRQDFSDVIYTLQANDWTIVDPWGEVHEAAKIGPDIRLAIILQAAHVTDDPYLWALLDWEYERNKDYLWLATFSFFNKYFEYFAFINNHPVWQAIFRLWPDRERAEHLFEVFDRNVRSLVRRTHNAFFDAVYYGACLRLGGCDPRELEFIRQDAVHTLYAMNPAPNYRRKVECPELPLDPFSVWADEFLREHPWLEELIDIDPQTLYPHEIEDRCWESCLWERSPYHVECHGGGNPRETGHGQDFMIAYWLGIYYGVLPGPGPFPDPPFVDDRDDADDDADDDTDDDIDDDTQADDDDDGEVGCGCSVL